ncbi:MAG: RlmE family RNA methyltransferase [Alphaproteobacteria bacterium]|jgi:23S rRNA (uridine2552-2'-O)-methyltransferase|nr:RlmE family RNA methyltransferase [Alphaproteobacteria bacterium]
MTPPAGRGKGGGGKSRPSGRNLSVRVRTARRRKTSSTRWLQRQLNDPYVIAARKDGYRSRAAYKLLQLDEKFGLLRKGLAAVDLGAAPGGWTQVLVTALGPKGKVLAVDVAEMDAMGGAQTLVGDVMDLATETAIWEALGGPADLVLSDMAPPATGHRATDHLRIIALAEAALDLARNVLAPGGGFVAKVWQGGLEQELLAALKRDFASVRHAKPEASRSDSAEMYVVATGYRGDAGGGGQEHAPDQEP